MNNYFILFIAIIGIILAILNNTIERRLSDTCTSNAIQTSLRVILVISVTFIVSSICYLICNMKCNCLKAESSLSSPMMFFLPFVGILGIILISTGAVIKNELSKLNCADSSAPSWIIAIGSFCLIGSIGAGVYQYRDVISSYSKFVYKKSSDWGSKFAKKGSDSGSDSGSEMGSESASESGSESA